MIDIAKPDIKPGESEDDYVARCIPFVIRSEGANPTQAAGKCHGMYRNSKTAKRFEIGLELVKYANEHACRLKEPGGMTAPWGRKTEDRGGMKVDVIYGNLNNHPVAQAYRYPVDRTEEGAARKHCADAGGSFTAASGGGTSKAIDGRFISTDSFKSPDDFIVDETVIVKAGEELHTVTGIVLEPDTVDGQGDIYSADEIRKAAHQFLADYMGQGNGFMHKSYGSTGLRIVESYVTPVEMKIGETLVKAGTWLMSTLIKDESKWALIKEGKITGYSIRGKSNAKEEIAEKNLLNKVKNGILENWEYLIHHIHVNEKTGKEEIHHCPLVDHLGNLYEIKEDQLKNGKITHIIIGLLDNQKVLSSEKEAIENGFKIPCANRQF